MLFDVSILYHFIFMKTTFLFGLRLGLSIITENRKVEEREIFSGADEVDKVSGFILFIYDLKVFTIGIMALFLIAY